MVGEMKLQMLIEAQNRAEGTLKEVQKQLQGINEGLAKTGESANKSSSIFTKAFAYKAAAIAAVTKLLKDSLQAYMEEERANKRLEILMMNVKGASMQQVGMLKEQAKAMQQLTTVQDDVVVSGQSQLATFQLQAGTIAQLIPSLLDMAVAVNGVSVSQEQMEGLANLLGKAMTGTAASLTRYGVTMTDAQKKTLETGNEMQKAAIMTKILQQNFGGLAEGMRNTLEGRIETVKNQFGDLKEEIGSRLKPVVTNLLIWLSDVGLPAVGRAIGWLSGAWEGDMLYMRSVTETVGWVITTTIKGWAIAIEAISNAMASLGKNSYIKQGWEGLQTGVDWVQGKIQGRSTSDVTAERRVGVEAMKGQSAKDILDQAFGTGSTGGGSGDTFNKDAQAKADKMRELLKAATDGLGGGGGGSGSGAAANKQAEAAKKLQEELLSRLSKARQGYRDLTGDATKALSSLKVAHDKNMADINKSIDDLKKNLESLTSSYNETIAGLDMGAGERVIQQQQKIKELSDEINKIQSEGGDASSQQQQLDKEKSALANFLSGRKDLTDEIAEAQRRANETDFERFVEDMNAKREKEKADYDAKRQAMEDELKTLEDQRTREQEIYAAKRQEYLDTLDTFNVFKQGYIDGMGEMETRTEASVKVMENRLAYLKRLLSEIESTTSTIQSARDQQAENAALPRAFGGSVNAGQAYRVGERGEEWFVPSSAGRIEPAGSKNYNISIPISISGGNADASKLAQMLEQKLPAVLARALQLKKAGVPANV